MMHQNINWNRVNAEFPLTQAREEVALFALKAGLLVDFYRLNRGLFSDKHLLRFVYHASVLKQGTDPFESFPNGSESRLKEELEAPVSFLARISQCLFITESTEIDSDLVLFAAWADYLGLRYDVYHFDKGAFQKIRIDSALEILRPQIRQIHQQSIAELEPAEELVLMGDYNSTGIWVLGGGMIEYDQLDLPLVLIHQLAIWADSYWHFLDVNVSCEWEKAYRQVQDDLAKEISVTLKTKKLRSVY